MRGEIGIPDTHSTDALCVAAEAERQAHEKLAKNGLLLTDGVT